MKLDKILVAVGLAVFALQANAALTFSSVAAIPGVYAAPVFTTGDASLAYLANNSIDYVQLKPLFDTNDYLVVQPGGSATIDLGGATSFSFLWGSPDPLNEISIDGVAPLSGTFLLGSLANSSNANTQWATFTSTTGMHDFTITTGQIAFEMAVAPVPEPETYALMLGGLGALAFVVRRRKA